MENKKSTLGTLFNAVSENPVFVLGIGLCPTLAMSNTMSNAFWLGLITLISLVIINVIVSLLRNLIPHNVRVPCYILIISTVITVLQLALKYYAPAIESNIGLFVALIIVNCIILGRAEAFASKNKPFISFLDGIGSGLGFLLAICLLGLLREIFGANSLTLFGVTKIFGDWYMPLSVLNSSAGAFILLGLLIALFNFIYSSIMGKRALVNKQGKETIAVENKIAEPIVVEKNNELKKVYKKIIPEEKKEDK